jgi:MerR family redox-sensitive transcriptional activator SoxR
VPASTLRFYEEKRLITSVGRRGLRPLFRPDVVERLALIGLGRVAGFSLDEIAQMSWPLRGSGAETIRRARAPTA